MSSDMSSSKNNDAPASPGHGEDRHGPPAGGSPRGRGTAVAIGTIVVFGALFVVGELPRMRLQPQLAAAAEEVKTARPIVTVVHPTRPPSSTQLQLPGNIQALTEATLSARASGYLKQWFVDIGDTVKAGQLLALIETPDTDALTVQARAQLSGSAASLQQSHASYLSTVAGADQARADLAKAEASLEQSKAQLSQAQAAVSQATAAASQQAAQVKLAQANLDLARVTNERYQELVSQGAVDRQAADQQAAAYKTNLATVESSQSALQASQANIASLQQAARAAAANVQANADSVRSARAAVTAAEANVTASHSGINAAAANVTSNEANYQHNAILSGFQRVTAPFDGIITARNVDVGSLVTTGGGPTAALAGPQATAATGGLFTMQRTDRVRIFVSIPQSFVANAPAGTKAQVLVQALSNNPFPGVVVRNASSLDATTRTLLTEIQVTNPQGKLRPGMFATVNFDIHRAGTAWRIPDSALVADAEGTRVAIVTTDNKIHFQTVVVGTDYGKEMDITEGLTGNETLVSNPNPSLQEGIDVQTVAAPVLAGPGGAGGGHKKS